MDKNFSWNIKCVVKWKAAAKIMRIPIELDDGQVVYNEILDVGSVVFTRVELSMIASSQYEFYNESTSKLETKLANDPYSITVAPPEINAAEINYMWDIDLIRRFVLRDKNNKYTNHVEIITKRARIAFRLYYDVSEKQVKTEFSSLSI